MSDLSDRRTDLPPRAIGVPDTGQGLFQKFEVRRTDGSSEPGGKHEGCEYFVLDTDHDPHAAAALRAYASACEGSHPLLARDLRQRHHLPAEAEMVSVPILRAFDGRFPIGHVELRRDALPPTPDWCISIGYEVRHGAGEYVLYAASITSDADYAKAIEREVDRGGGATRSEAQDGERTHAKRLLDRHCSIELRCTLSAHQDEWWRLNRDREASEADILQVLAAGLQARRVESDRKPAAGMNFSKVKLRGTGLGLVVLTETARWAGGTHDEYGGWTFSPEAWGKFTTSLSADQPMEILTSPGVSAPESVVHKSCMLKGCQEALTCPQGKCAMGPGEQA